MKHTLYLLLFCLLGSTAYCQNDADTKKFINEVITEKAIIYQDSIGKFATHIMHEGLWYPQAHEFFKETPDSVIYISKSGKQTPMSRAKATPLVLRNIGDRMRPVILDSMTMSVAEMKYVNAEIDKMSGYKWQRGLFENSQIISTDTVNAVFKDWKRRGWNYMYNTGIHKYYTFAKPIFLQNSNFCLFYYGYSCGDLCGYGEFALYKKENGKWVHWAVVSGWIS